jgi:hypothetical protein
MHTRRFIFPLKPFYNRITVKGRRQALEVQIRDVLLSSDSPRVAQFDIVQQEQSKDATKAATDRLDWNVVRYIASDC